MRARLGEGRGDAKADAAPRPGDERAPAIEAEGGRRGKLIGLHGSLSS